MLAAAVATVTSDGTAQDPPNGVQLPTATVTSDGTNGGANEVRLLTEMQPLCTPPMTTEKLSPTAKRATKRKLEF